MLQENKIKDLFYCSIYFILLHMETDHKTCRVFRISTLSELLQKTCNCSLVSTCCLRIKSLFVVTVIVSCYFCSDNSWVGSVPYESQSLDRLRIAEVIREKPTSDDHK